MSSQEDYLDQLLKNMNQSTENTEPKVSLEEQIAAMYEPYAPKEVPDQPEAYEEVRTAVTEPGEATEVVDAEPEAVTEVVLAEPEKATEVVDAEPEAVNEVVYEAESEAAVTEPETVIEPYAPKEVPDQPEAYEKVQTATAEPEAATEEAVVEPEAATEEASAEPEAATEEAVAEPEPLMGAGMDDIRALLQEAQQDDRAEEDSDILSEEEIEKLLNLNKTGAEQEKQELPSVDEDLMSILDGTSGGDEDLEDIHSMLQKAENNIAVDEGIGNAQDDIPDALAALNAVLDGETSDSAEDEFAGLSEKEKKTILKKREKEEKAARKKAEREAKKAEKEAKRAERKAMRQKNQPPAEETAAEETVAEGDIFIADEGTAVQAQADNSGRTNIPIQSDEPIAMDMSDLDAILGISEPQNSEQETGTVPDTDSAQESIRELGAEAEGEIALDEAELDAKLKEAEEGKKPKKGLIAKIIDFLMEDDEEEAETSGGTEDVPLSDENKNILEEMDQEGKGKKNKKGKKPKKDKKAKNAAADDEEGDEEGGTKGKGKKAKKAPKPKKEKVKEPVDPKDRIHFKRVLPIIAACASLLLVLILLVNIGGDFTVKQEAKRAYYQEDYETCYQVLYGKKLNESEQVMFGKSESILRIRLWMREYEIFADEGAETEALDVLIQAVNDYSELYEYAKQWNADGDISVIYSQMLNILQQKYYLTEGQALEIAAEPDDVEYTRKVTAAAKGLGFAGSNEGTMTELPDMLPEEKQFPENYGGR